MTLKEERTYNSLNEALLAGARFTHVGDNGEYVEYLAYESGNVLIINYRTIFEITLSPIL